MYFCVLKQSKIIEIIDLHLKFMLKKIFKVYVLNMKKAFILIRISISLFNRLLIFLEKKFGILKICNQYQKKPLDVQLI